ncbi:MAG: hypothetical protein GX455_16820 [Phycisphaerae bacterium]|nr:hypothetical protein [Phycisphaerae bacterium]
MDRVIAYMLTWTTYGTWLQGDPRGYVKKGRAFGPNSALFKANQSILRSEPVYLSDRHREITRQAIGSEAAELGQTVLALQVGRKHIHLVVNCGQISPQKAVSHYKNAARIALSKEGLSGRIWTRGYSKRLCFDGLQLKTVMAYVQNHELEPQDF